MRPKKLILLVDPDERYLSERSFALETRLEVRVLRATSAALAISILHAQPTRMIDLLICELIIPEMDGNELVRRAKQICPDMRTGIVSRHVSAFDRACYADVFLPKEGCANAEFLECCRRMLARKRGPKPRHAVREAVAA